MSISEDVAFDDLMKSKQQLKRNLESTSYPASMLNSQLSQSSMKNQLNPSCWDALQSFRDLNVNAPLADCLLDLRAQIKTYEDALIDLRKQIAVKNKAEKCIEDLIKESQEIKNKLQNEPDVVKNELDHTITIDGVVYYSAEHHKPVGGEIVLGYRPFTNYAPQNEDFSLPSCRPMPQIAWYSLAKSCWFVSRGSGCCEENIKVWTKLPHPREVQELFDFMDKNCGDK